MQIEKITRNKEQKHPWGFPQPTILIDSQSAPPLRGSEAEQRYYRMFLMGGTLDVAVTNYPINEKYLQYVKGRLGIPLPDFLYIPNVRSGSLSGDILRQEDALAKLRSMIKQGMKLQFFNFLAEEQELALLLLEEDPHISPLYPTNLEAYKSLGTKTGFRRFCQQFDIPMPQGAVCESVTDVIAVATEIDGDSIVKADTGTGGAELGSNVTLPQLTVLSGNMEEVERIIQQLSPSDPPYDVQKKMNGFSEGSLHVFLDSEGNLVSEPTVFGQFAHEGSYVGGHYPNKLPCGFNATMQALAREKIIPALRKIGATGMHCLDCLFDPVTNDVYFIEDNTRPGALDFINHFVQKVSDTHRLEDPVWYHYQLPIAEIAGHPVTFDEIQLVLSDMLTPGDGFIVLSNPDVLPFGYSLHITAISTGSGSSPEKSKAIYLQATEILKNHFGYSKEIKIPEYDT